MKNEVVNLLSALSVLAILTFASVAGAFYLWFGIGVVVIAINFIIPLVFYLLLKQGAAEPGWYYGLMFLTAFLTLWTCTHWVVAGVIVMLKFGHNIHT